MAHIVPGLTEVKLSGAPSGEVMTLEHLKANLSDDFTVYHGVFWALAAPNRPNREETGEIDFVVVNRDGRVLAIEQKDGQIDEDEYAFTKQYKGKKKDIFAQIRQNVNTIKRLFGERGRDKQKLSVDYIIYTPEYRLAGRIATGVSSKRIVDLDGKSKLAKKISEKLGAGTGENADFSEFVRNFFQETYQVVPDVHAIVDDQERSFTRLNGSLVNFLDNIANKPLRLRVRGVAGCGKTGIAIRFYERAVAANKRPLLLCFNRPLREKLKAIVPAAGLVQTWNGFCGDFLTDCGAKPEYGHVFDDPHFWDKVESEVRDRALEGRIPDSWKFDGLIIDEAQDFHPEWFEILRLFLNEDHDIIWLEDPDQNIRRSDTLEKVGFVDYREPRNFRSPRVIADFIRDVLPFNFDPASESIGWGMNISPYDDPVDQPKLVEKRVAELIRSGFKTDQVVLLTMHGFNNSVLSDSDLRLGNFMLRRFTGKYDSLGNQRMTEGHIHFDSIHRFKGQQSPAVILCDVDPDPKRVEDWEKLLYCGMTRATAHLEILAARRANPLSKRLIDASR